MGSFGRRTLLLSDKQALVIIENEIRAAHGAPPGNLSMVAEASETTFDEVGDSFETNRTSQSKTALERSRQTSQSKSTHLPEPLQFANPPAPPAGFASRQSPTIWWHLGGSDDHGGSQRLYVCQSKLPSLFRPE